MNLLMTAIVVNAEPVRIIERCLSSVVSVSNQITAIVTEKREKDRGLTGLLQKYNVEPVEYANLEGTVVEEWRNKQLELGEYHDFKWVLIIDPDEYLMPDAIRFLDKNIKALNDPSIVGIAFPRVNTEWNPEGDQMIYYAGYPDPQIRLVRPTLRYDGIVHHPIIVPEGKYAIMANGHIMHDKSHESLSERNRKTKLYLKKEKGEHIGKKVETDDIS